MRSRFISLAVPLALASAPLAAQHSPNDILEPERLRLDVPAGDVFGARTLGMSWHSPRGPKWGKIVNRRLYLLGFAREHEVRKGASLRMTQELTFAVVERASSTTKYCYGGTTMCQIDVGPKVAVGVGVMPIGIKRMLGAPGDKRRFFAAGAIGGILFSDDVPVDFSRRANFVLEAGVGVDIAADDGSVLTIGYKLHHISNGGTGQLNPGLDANVVYLSIARPRDRR